MTVGNMRARSRLTITLPLDLLAQIDHQIDGQTIRNRSHAIELLLRESLRPTVSTALLLAGRPPKNAHLPPLLSIQGRPLIEWTISHLVDHGINTIFILAGPNEAGIKSALGEGRHMGATLHYLGEPEPLGTAGAIKLAEPYLEGGPVLVAHADVLTNINLTDFFAFHSGERTLATIAVKPRQSEPNYGKVMLQGNRITDFIETSHDRGISIVNTGVYLLEPEVLGMIEAGVRSGLEGDVFPKLAGMGELSAFLFQGIWFDISKPENYESAQARWQQQGGITHAARK